MSASVKEFMRTLDHAALQSLREEFEGFVAQARREAGEIVVTSLIHDDMAFVGDALFAGSLGGTRSLDNYRTQHQAVAEKLLDLDEKTVLFPGHGPATTVGEERAHNPFFI